MRKSTFGFPGGLTFFLVYVGTSVTYEKFAGDSFSENQKKTGE